ncbi:NtaA/DmoA family FMN-dependent monooxygenase [Rouxiella badensis]|uniref:NtaA/DmoA family FMN-dependent monooxygenase n=1 Tax=Rouxiella badensis TaxID=1646377 RepID=UPI00178865B4|nr:NtaA/DmoA family FMN-dependent monooxygenase [Rouxiella badensis]MCC3701846.1 NtaA/DmoA family FMN-dependent monooxygenase [Rouxiella badensis]QOI55047.1 NtaA/DmoA family FMN-dependent monooxygenase [Rouxiella badensis subsp. acadiensis]
MSSMHLALFLDPTGCHYSGWRIPAANPVPAASEWSVLKALTLKAEAAKFDMVFMADKLSIDDIYNDSFNDAVQYRITERPEPFSVLSALGAVTEKIGLAGTVSSSFIQPFAAARTLATLDHLTGGRAAWNVVTSTSDAEARNFGQTLLSHEQRYLKAEAFIHAVRTLWDTWDDNAILANRKSGVYADGSRIRYADIDNDWFKVKGPLNVPRSPQGHPVTIQAGGSGPFTALAAREADAIFAAEKSDLASAQKYYADLKSRVVEHGRAADSLKVLPGLQPIVGDTQKEADEILAELTQLHHPLATLTHLSNTMNYDWGQHHLDDLVPDIAALLGRRERFEPMLNHARNNGMTLRDFAKWVARSGFIVAGTADSLAERMTTWYRERAVDGFVIMPPFVPAASDAFFSKVVPLLQERGVFRREYTADTLRGHLGLERPTPRVNR